MHTTNSQSGMLFSVLFITFFSQKIMQSKIMGSQCLHYVVLCMVLLAIENNKRGNIYKQYNVVIVAMLAGN